MSNVIGRTNKGQLSNVLAKEMPILTKPGVWQAIEEAVARVFRDDAPADRS